MKPVVGVGGGGNATARAHGGQRGGLAEAAAAVAVVAAVAADVAADIVPLQRGRAGRATALVPPDQVQVAW